MRKIRFRNALLLSSLLFENNIKTIKKTYNENNSTNNSINNSINNQK